MISISFSLRRGVMQGDWAGYLLNSQWYRELKKSVYLGKPHFKCQQSQGQSSIRPKGHKQNHSEGFRAKDKEPKGSRSLASTEGPWQCFIMIPLCISFLLLHNRLPPIQRLRAAQIYYIPCLEVQHGSYWSTLKISAELSSFPEALGLHCWLLDAVHIPLLVAPYTIFTSSNISPNPFHAPIFWLTCSVSLSLSIALKNPCNYIEHCPPPSATPNNAEYSPYFKAS